MKPDDATFIARAAAILAPWAQEPRRERDDYAAAQESNIPAMASVPSKRGCVGAALTELAVADSPAAAAPCSLCNSEYEMGADGICGCAKAGDEGYDERDGSAGEMYADLVRGPL